MNNSGYFLGVDGGGSKTAAVVYSSDGKYICSATGDSINYCSVGLEKARLAMADIINRLSVKEFDCAVIGSAALNGRASAEETENFCNGIINSKNIIMDSDLYIALESTDSDGECAAVISGTGSMAVMRNADGEIKTAGGWGYILGDEGSGYSIGLCGIKAAIRGFEKSAPETTLTQKCLDYFGITDIFDLIDLYYDKSVSRKITAAFAKDVISSADSGDSVAKNIIESEVKALSEQVLSIVSCSDKSIKIGLWGGVFQHNPSYRNRFIGLLSAKGYDNVELIKFTPELGAITACFRNEGIELTENLKNTILREYNI